MDAGNAKLGQAELRAVWALRRLLCGGIPCGGRLWGDPAALGQAAEALRRYGAASGSGKRDLRLNPPGSVAVTRDERRMLRALAAAQDDDAAGVDRALYKIALDRDLRACLAEGVLALAAALAAQGHWLPSFAQVPPWMSAGPAPEARA